jgi:hypothetical protein
MIYIQNSREVAKISHFLDFGCIRGDLELDFRRGRELKYLAHWLIHPSSGLCLRICMHMELLRLTGKL